MHQRGTTWQRFCGRPERSTANQKPSESTISLAVFQRAATSRPRSVRTHSPIASPSPIIDSFLSCRPAVRSGAVSAGTGTSERSGSRGPSLRAPQPSPFDPASLKPQVCHRAVGRPARHGGAHGQETAEELIEDGPAALGMARNTLRCCSVLDLAHDPSDRASVLHDGHSRHSCLLPKISLASSVWARGRNPPVYAIVARDQHAIHFRCAQPPTANPNKYSDELLDAYLCIEDADSLYAEYAAQDVEFTRGPANTPWHSREFVVKIAKAVCLPSARTCSLSRSPRRKHYSNCASPG